MEGKCPSCGAMLVNGECEYCGHKDKTAEKSSAQTVVVNVTNVNNTNRGVAVSSKDWLVTLLLAIVLGWCGGHKFYEGKIGMGILYLFTAGIFCFGWWIDIFRIALNKETDSNGLIIHREITQQQK